MKIETRTNFHKVFEEVFGKPLPDTILYEEKSLRKGQKRFSFVIDFFLHLNDSLFKADNEQDSIELAFSRENKFNGMQPNVMSYTHVYEVYSGEEESVILDLKNHKERIEKEMRERFKDLGTVSVFFRPKD